MLAAAACRRTRRTEIIGAKARRKYSTARQKNREQNQESPSESVHCTSMLMVYSSCARLANPVKCASLKKAGIKRKNSRKIVVTLEILIALKFKNLLRI